MSGLEVRSLDSPDETRAFADDMGRAAVISLESGSVMRGMYEPGWRWTKHIGPIAGTDSCQTAHLGYVVSGRMKVVMDDGAEAEIGPGDVFSIGPGHDAWVLGDEPCVMVDFGRVENYAKG